jgi:hypothetical protein
MSKHDDAKEAAETAVEALRKAGVRARTYQASGFTSAPWFVIKEPCDQLTIQVSREEALAVAAWFYVDTHRKLGDVDGQPILSAEHIAALDAYTKAPEAVDALKNWPHGLG